MRVRLPSISYRLQVLQFDFEAESHTGRKQTNKVIVEFKVYTDHMGVSLMVVRLKDGKAGVLLEQINHGRWWWWKPARVNPCLEPQHELGLSLLIMTFSRTMMGPFHFTNFKSKIIRGPADSFIQILLLVFKWKKKVLQQGFTWIFECIMGWDN